jgi:SAM-dependent methyltransferase
MCGAGRIAVHLAQAGIQITGIDREPTFIHRARSIFKDRLLKGRFIISDIRTLTFDRDFDCAFNWGGSFGYYSNAENESILQALVKAVRIGGRILIDQPNREYLLRHFRSESQNGDLCIKNRWDPKHERIESDWMVMTKGHKKSNKMSIRLYTAKQMTDLLRSAGCSSVWLKGSISGEEYSRTSKRLIAIGISGPG